MCKEKELSAAEFFERNGFFGKYIIKNACIRIDLVILYFSIPHGASTLCLCQLVGRGDETAGGKN